MLIFVGSPNDGSGKSTCAVNLACELAGLGNDATNRWQGEHSIVLIDADAEGTATRCCSGGHLPVSCSQLTPDNSRNLVDWIRRMRAVAMEVDYVVVDGPSGSDVIVKAIIGISDLVVIPYSVSASNLATIDPIIRLIKAARSTRSDRGPKCLIVPTHVDVVTGVRRDIETTLNAFGEPVGPPIQEWIEFADAFNAGRWIGDYAPKSTAYENIRALGETVEVISTNIQSIYTGPRS